MFALHLLIISLALFSRTHALEPEPASTALINAGAIVQDRPWVHVSHDPPLPPSHALQSETNAKVARARKILTDLDTSFPDMHLFGHKAAKRHLLDLNPTSSSSHYPFHHFNFALGVDVHVPITDISAWLNHLDSFSSFIKTDSSKHQLRNYLTQANDALRTLTSIWNSHKHPDAGFVVAQIALFGNYSLPVAPKIAFDVFNELAQLTGNATAHYYLGVFYATNLGNVLGDSNSAPIRTHVRQDRSLIHYSLAAASGNSLPAEMTLASKYHMGIGVIADCQKAGTLYYAAAKRVIEFYLSGPPGGHRLPPYPVRLSDDVGGVYGPASTSKHGGSSEGMLSEADAFDYYKMLAEKGSIRHQVELGRVLYVGTSAVAPDYRRSFKYFNLAASTDWKAMEKHAVQDPWSSDHEMRDQKNSGPDPASEAVKDAKKMIGIASGYVGQMYLRGEAVVANNATAKIWFRRGHKLGDALSVTWLAIMELDDHASQVSGNPKLVNDPPTRARRQKALSALLKAAKANQPLALASVGEHFYQQGHYADAVQYFSIAVSHGHLFSIFRLAHLHIYGLGTSSNCDVGVNYLRQVAERGMDWLDPVLLTAHNLQDAGTNLELCQLLYLLGAERGVEVAQSNLAWLLEYEAGAIAQLNKHQFSVLETFREFWRPLLQFIKSVIYGVERANSEPSDPSPNTSLQEFAINPYFPANVIDLEEVALLQWIRAANLNNEDARVKVGDYYYYGRGTNQSYTQAAASYIAATHTQQSGIAFWNLGYMYHHALGVDADYHLAKRYYDLSLSADANAWLPVSLSLMHLYASNWKQVVFGTDAGPSEDRALGEPASDEPVISKPASDVRDTGHAEPEEDWSWHDLAKRRSATRPGVLGQLWQSFVFALLGNNYEEEEVDADGADLVLDELETTVLVGCCLLLAYLVYVRQNRELQQPFRAPVPVPPPANTLDREPAQGAQVEAASLPRSSRPSRGASPTPQSSGNGSSGGGDGIAFRDMVFSSDGGSTYFEGSDDDVESTTTDDSETSSI